MSWVSLLQPDLILGEPILGLTPAMIAHHQLQGLILDVDETLVPLREADTSPEVHTWCNQIKPLVSLWLVSNNLNQSRIRRIAEVLDLPYFTGAGKPSRRKLRQAATEMGLPFNRIGMVGDRLFTDVLAGNRLGMFTVLVEPMVNPSTGLAGKPLVRSLEVWISQQLGVSLQSLP
ncbi:MAG: YqeG family HAD IIIA-type phosphatase [Cyanobacteria bacterium]|nr:YqeG family HAD IIIA-type phosphatase [Cyanobacteriota bacterium]MEB3269433.1 YqeG family HAD IIIA-type phosphatase [Leptolyngbya sp.]